jgi:hypothetical protein
MTKKPYTTPEMERIELDREISLQLLSPPLGPGGEIVDPDPFGDPEAFV